jgi:hypothetical protein
MSSALPPSRLAPAKMLIGALLRVPAQAVHRRIIKELNAAGFEELRVPHMAVLCSSRARTASVPASSPSVPG